MHVRMCDDTAVLVHGTSKLFPQVFLNTAAACHQGLWGHDEVGQGVGRMPMVNSRSHDHQGSGLADDQGGAK
jgi:hypothetical protein